MKPTTRILAELKDRVSQLGAASLSDRELLTALLAYTDVPDPDGVSLQLLTRFHSLGQILYATVPALTDCGVTQNAATLIRMLLPLWGEAMLSDLPAKQPLSDSARIGEYLIRRFAGLNTETVYLLLLRADYTLISCLPVAQGSVNTANLNNRTLVERALFAGAAFAVVAHNHPAGDTCPSQCDLDATDSLVDAFDAVGIPLLEHFVVAGRSYAPIMYRANRPRDCLPADFYADAGEVPW